MSSLQIPKQHEDFLEFLRDQDLQKRYSRESRRIIRRAKKEFEREETQNIQQLERGLSLDDEHRRVLNACVYPFATGRIPGYFLVRVAPLAEKRVANLDFFIAGLSPSSNEIEIAIFGESKGQINDPEDTVSKTKTRIDVLQANWEYVRKQYLSGMVFSVDFPREFVLGVLSSDSNEVAKSVVRKNGGIIVWSVDFSNEPILSLHRPDLDNQQKQIRETMFHRNDRLNQILKKFPTTDTFYLFYEQSHPIAKLRILTAIDKARPNADVFTFEEVKAVVKEELDYVSEEEIIMHETSSIIEDGLKIGFIRDMGNGRYKIRSRSKEAAVREQDLKQLWIRWTLSEKLNERTQPLLVDLQRRYEGERLSRPTLEETTQASMR